MSLIIAENDDTNKPLKINIVTFSNIEPAKVCYKHKQCVFTDVKCDLSKYAFTLSSKANSLNKIELSSCQYESNELRCSYKNQITEFGLYSINNEYICFK